MLGILTREAEIAASVTAILGAVVLLLRLAMAFTPVRRAVHWITDGYRRDQEARFLTLLRQHLPDILNEKLSFNGTGRFSDDMRAMYEQVNQLQELVIGQLAMDEAARTGLLDRRKDTP